MTQRINFLEKGQNAIKSLYSIGGYLAKCPLEPSLLELVALRVSQMNGCAFCLDMHSKDLLAHGESAQRMYTLNAWRETPFFSDKERAALMWAEAVTNCVVPDETFAEARKYFSEEELIDLTLSVSSTNLWNRINISFHPLVGTYQAGEFK
jgi:AhpD family alkylhydroperoxidase